MGRKISEPLRRLLAAVICFSLIFAAVLVLSPVSAEDLSEGETAVAVEDLYDVTESHLIVRPSGTSDNNPLGTLSKKRDVAFVTDFRFAIDNTNNSNACVLGVFSTGTNIDSNGFWFIAQKNNPEIRLVGYSGWTGTTRDSISVETAETSEQKAVLSKFFNYTWVTLEFGRKTAGEETLVYVAFDGVTVLQFADTTADDALGTNIVTEMLNRAEMQSSKVEATGSATVTDLYDLTGEVSHDGISESVIGELPSAENAAFRTKLRITDLTPSNPVYLHVNGGYWFVADPRTDSRDPYIMISAYGSSGTAKDRITADNLDPAQSAAFDKVMSGGWFELEFGRLTASAGETPCYIIYAKIDGVEVLRFVDTQTISSAAVKPEMSGRGEMRTAYEPEYTETQSTACLYETVGALALESDVSISDALSVSDSESTAFITEARITNMANGYGLMLGAFASEPNGNSGYWFIARPTEGRIYLSYGWNTDYADITAYSDGEEKTAYDAVMSGDWFTLEFGRVPATLQEETGFAVYAKINGVTVLQFFDTRTAQDLGSMFCTQIGGRAQLRTTYRESEIAAGFAALGGSVRVSEPNTGLRFQFEFDESVIASLAELGVTAEYGAVLLPSEMLGENELTLETADVLDIPAENPGTGENGGVLISAVLTGIPEAEYATAVTARAYIKLTAGEHVTIIYSEALERSVQQVAQAALADPDGGYTPEQIAVLEKFAGSAESSVS